MNKRTDAGHNSFCGCQNSTHATPNHRKPAACILPDSQTEGSPFGAHGQRGQGGEVIGPRQHMDAAKGQACSGRIERKGGKGKVREVEGALGFA